MPDRDAVEAIVDRLEHGGAGRLGPGDGGVGVGDLEVQRHADRGVGRVDAVLGVGVGEVEAVAGDVDLAVADAAVVAADDVADDPRAEHLGVEGEGGVGTGAAGDEVGPQALAGDDGGSVVVMVPPGGVGVEQVVEPAAQLRGEGRVRSHRRLGLAEGVEGVKLSHRRSLRRLGGTPGGRARAAPRWRGRCGRGARPPRGRTGRRGSASVRAERWWAPSRPSTSWATAASRCASHGSSSGAGSSATARRLRSSRACRRQWSTSLWRATPISHAVVSCGTVPFCTAATAARNVSAVRSSATVGPSHRRTR